MNITSNATPIEMTGGAALIRALEQHGVDTVFGIPGTHNLAAYAALADSPIRSVLTRHEQGAGYAADGYARVTGRPGVVLTTTGPAILNAVAAAAQAWSDSVPVLFISPGMPLTHPGRGNGYLHEVKDQHAALDAVVAYSHRVTSVQEIPSAVAYAFSAMQTGRPRPVHIEIPIDLFEQSGPVRMLAPVMRPVASADTAAVATATDLLRSARRPTVIVGGGARGAAPEVLRIAERLAAPVLSTANGKGVFDEEHPLSVGAGLHHPSVAQLLADSDVILAIGTELAPSDLWNGPLDLDDRLVRIDIDAMSVVTNADPRVRLVGAADTVLEQLLVDIGDHDAGAPREDDRARAAREALAGDARTEGAPWVDIVAALASVVDQDMVLAGDSTMVCYYGALSGLRVRRPGGFLYPTGVGTLGYGLPAAIGASLSGRTQRVLALIGDGGAMFTLPELATAAALGLALPIVIVDNGGYGEIRNEMDDRGDTVHSVRLGGIDFAAIARAMGCHGITVQRPEDLAAEISTAWGADRPTVLHISEHSRASQ
ncbi:thiamine pyrophosphate-binding protein [Dermatophilaceae bacterium Sec6.4]